MQNIFDQNIINYLGLAHLDEGKQKETLLRVGKVIYQAVIMRVMDLLDEPTQDEFDKLLDEVGEDETRQDKIMEFLKAKIPNLDEIAKEEIAKFKAETVSVMGELE